jgi:hypothetical protein
MTLETSASPQKVLPWTGWRVADCRRRQGCLWDYQQLELFGPCGRGLSENNYSQVRVYICCEVLWVWDVWFARGKCEILRKDLLVCGDD